MKRLIIILFLMITGFARADVDSTLINIQGYWMNTQGNTGIVLKKIDEERLTLLYYNEFGKAKFKLNYAYSPKKELELIYPKINAKIGTIDLSIYKAYGLLYVKSAMFYTGYYVNELKRVFKIKIRDARKKAKKRVL